MICIVLALEAMDKEWPLWFVLAGFLGLGAIGLFACRKRPVAAVLLLPLIGFGAVRQIAELNDPYVGSAIRAEAGFSYVVLSYLAIGCSLVLIGVGTVQGWKRRKLGVNS